MLMSTEAKRKKIPWGRIIVYFLLKNQRAEPKLSANTECADSGSSVQTRSHIVAGPDDLPGEKPSLARGSPGLHSCGASLALLSDERS